MKVYSTSPFPIAQMVQDFIADGFVALISLTSEQRRVGGQIAQQLRTLGYEPINREAKTPNWVHFVYDPERLDSAKAESIAITLDPES
ncbi:hypothetical protein PUP68_22190 [Pseudomonas chlororaphis]|uniref:hypothetical protein n=1 Tax=Pseudomonas chlororaphis TaxID=587753 RepID=UPI0006A65774|nr:hypothetical protein [Pseudomonas chlororaphis]AZC32114.1 hypothetical protein C4K38_4158 [Pseudomonas chlororaphis subsp. piscium]WDG77213.1 hypothetical protein PUP77_22670 [Pseudomonas chlororaphis]WDG83548.1 hypothetical protein PUP68_22190 [Pseudomonas chlororaphis]WDG89850.1 hypothetical protein PUP49_21480 [Pseudomonas chlororaphis]SDS73542.1 hypothetical protein SAMN05216585_3234 [Pseudomonas chlororaphis]